MVQIPPVTAQSPIAIKILQRSRANLIADTARQDTTTTLLPGDASYP